MATHDTERSSLKRLLEHPIAQTRATPNQCADQLDDRVGQIFVDFTSDRLR